MVCSYWFLAFGILERLAIDFLDAHYEPFAAIEHGQRRLESRRDHAVRRPMRPKPVAHQQGRVEFRSEHRQRLEAVEALAVKLDVPLTVTEGYDMVDFLRRVSGRESAMSQVLSLRQRGMERDIVSRSIRLPPLALLSMNRLGLARSMSSHIW